MSDGTFYPEDEEFVVSLEHPIINPHTMKEIFEQYKDSFQTIPLEGYLDMGLKIRGSGNGTLNSHDETFIVRTQNGAMMVKSRLDIHPDDIILGVSSWGNKFQMIEAVVQGYNPNDPNSGFERPILHEGPHMIIGLYAFDKERKGKEDYCYDTRGDLHLFRTLQLRNNQLIVDTPRGFAEAKMLETGEQVYNADPEQVTKNLMRIVKEEAGSLQIKHIKFLGADICNTTCITSLSALYAVEINYESFLKFSGVVSENEARRRTEQLTHEGLIGKIFDLTVGDYLTYRSDPNIIKDMAADRISDYIIMTHNDDHHR